MYLCSFLLLASLFKCLGVPTVQDLVSIYCGCRRIPPALPNLNFYLALSIFKIAGIAQVCVKFHNTYSFLFSYIKSCKTNVGKRFGLI